MIGRTISHYEIIAKLGEGGMGEVFQARDTLLHRTVALKVLPADRLGDPARRERFLREARAASALSHRHVITIHDVVTDGDLDCIVMEYVQGQPLNRRIPPGGLPVARAARYARQIAAAVQVAHQAGLVHRDLKPANVMVTSDDEVRVLDFGLAKRLEIAGPDAPTAASIAPRTQLGTVLGTLDYMSPEQALGRPADARSDVFSLGVMLYEMLTGRRPFRGDSAPSLLHDVAFGEPPPAPELRADLPTALAEILRRALQKDPETRIQTMAELAERLREVERAAEIAARSPAPSGAGAEPATGHGNFGAGTWRAEAAAISGSGTAVADRPGDQVDGRPRAGRLALPSGRPGLYVAFVAVALLTAWALLGLPGLRPALDSLTARLSAASARGSTSEPEQELDSLTPLQLLENGLEHLARYDREGYVDLAIDRFQRAIAKQDGHAAAYAALSQAYWRKYRRVRDPHLLPLGLANAERAIELDPQLTAGRASRGLVRIDMGEAAGAAEDFEVVLRLDPANPVALRGLAELAEAAGDLERARSLFEQAIEADPDDWDLPSHLGQVFYSSGRYAEAETAYRRAVELTPDNFSARKVLAAALHMQGNYAAAAAELQRALAIRQDAGVYNNLGTLYFFQGLYQEAVKAFERAVELGPNEYLRWANLADAYRATPGNASQASEAYLRAIQLLREELRAKPDDPVLQSRLALFLAKRGDREAALAELERLEARAPEDPSTLFRLALGYEIAGARARALTALERALAAGYSLTEIKAEPDLEKLRADARYHRLVMRFEGRTTSTD